MSTRHLIMIGDIIDSRQLPDREGVQQSLAGALARLNERRADALASPYTVTLGDEFQTVLNRAAGAFADLAQLQAALHPVQVRFSLAVGEISTPINPDQAIGMDGPGFYRARDQLTAMKKAQTLFSVAGLEGPCARLVNQTLFLISQEMRSWPTSRWQVLERLNRDMKVSDIAAELGMSDKGVYKTISAGMLHAVQETFAEIEAMVDREL